MTPRASRNPATSSVGTVPGAFLAFVSATTASQLRRNTAAGGVGAVVGVAISAASYPIYLHFLGYEQYGLWLAVSVVLSFVAIGHLGLASAVATTVAEEYARGSLTGVRETVSTALGALSAIGATALASVILGRSVIVAALHLRPQLAGQASKLLPYVGFLSVYAVQIDTLNAVLAGLGRLDLAVGTQQVGRVLSLALATAMLAAGFGVISLPIGALAGNVFVHAASLLLASKITGRACFGLSAFKVAHLRRLVTFGSAVLASTLINFLLSPLNKFALVRCAGPASVPVYDMAYTMTMQIRGLLDSGLSSLMPEASRLKTLASEESRRRIHQVYRRAMQIILGLALPIFSAVLIFAHTALQLWLGARLRIEVISSLRVLLVGSFISLLGVPGYYVLLGTRRVKHVFTAHAVQSCVNAAAIACLWHAGSLSAFSASCAASAGLAAAGIYLVIASHTTFAWNTR